MPATKQQAALTAISSLVSIINQAVSMRAAVDALLAEYNSENYSATWAGMATAQLNADGSIGTPDSTPNPADPITVGAVYRSCNALVNGITFCQDFQKFLTNQAVSTAQRSQTLDDLVD
jgi:hypothetical protein